MGGDLMRSDLLGKCGDSTLARDCAVNTVLHGETRTCIDWSYDYTPLGIRLVNGRGVRYCYWCLLAVISLFCHF